MSAPGGIAAAYLDNGYSVVGWPISPGLYAGRMGDRVKIEQSINVGAPGRQLQVRGVDRS